MRDSPLCFVFISVIILLLYAPQMRGVFFVCWMVGEHFKCRTTVAKIYHYIFILNKIELTVIKMLLLSERFLLGFVFVYIVFL